MKKILVTGGSGFIGTNFINFLNKKSFDVLNIDKISKVSTPEKFKKKSKNYKFHKINMLHKKKIEKILFKFRPDLIINFAAESHVDRSIDNPDEFLINNFSSATNLFSIFRKFSKLRKKSKLIHISTDEVFGSNNSKPSKENSLYKPSSPYSSSKASADLVAFSFNKTYKTNIQIVNLCNCYGSYQFLEKFIPTCIFSLIKNKPLPLYGKGKNVREWMHVNDACRAIFKIALGKDKNFRYNIGSNLRYNNINIAKKIFQILKKQNLTKLNKKNYFRFVKDRPGHDLRYALNSSLFKKTFKFKTYYKLDDGLQNTINWYLNNKKWTNYILKKFTGKRLGLNG